jgi:hypothetical protein
MDEIAKTQQHDDMKVKVLRLQELMGEVLRQIESVSINLLEIEKVVEPWVVLLGRAASGLVETKDWTSRVESDVAGLPTAIKNGARELRRSSERRRVWKRSSQTAVRK